METIERHDMGSKNKMSLSVKIWLAAVAVFGVMMGLFMLSTSSSGTEMVLRQGETAEFGVFRPFSTEKVWYRQCFYAESNRPELGEYSTNNDDTEEWKTHWILRFNNPGEPVHVAISLNGQTCRYQALPTSTMGYHVQCRQLSTPADGSGKAFYFVPTCQLHERPGWNKGSITVEKVSPVLAGERVTLIGNPPLQFESYYPGSIYNLVWPMFLWPIWLFILILWGIILGISRYRRHKQTKQTHPEA
ncbi:hypothetical protein [Eikenella sp. Marseille-P7795]|uniref:hypothetical protein n=1 Tax=Eikenella sp. Marseille-P7795 TaxID=2866577 RepID=UPI001CE441BD|nr:hypothetical protein [Eikenella sp. Marseille-P7795]